MTWWGKKFKGIGKKKEAEYMKLISEKERVTKNFIERKKLINDLNFKKESIEKEINKELENTKRY